MARMNPDGESHAAERVIAPVPDMPMYQAPLAPRQMYVERQGELASPYTRRFPEVRGGICEYCGVIDPKYPSEYQYKLCEHYRGKQLFCSYCPPEKNPDDVINHSILKIAEHPDNPNKMVVWCDSFECSKKHLARFNTNG